MLKNSFAMLGIGNAIVDIVVKVSEGFVEELPFTKGGMYLISENECEQLLGQIQEQGIDYSIHSGGSVANTAYYLSKFSLSTGLIGNVADGEFGRKFISDSISANLKFINVHDKDDNRSAKCIILVTPDGERTMCTYLGCAGKLALNKVPDHHIEGANYIFSESYLLDNSYTSNELSFFLQRPILADSKFALSLSDSECVKRNINKVKELLYERASIVIGNKSEFAALFGKEQIEKNNLGDLQHFFTKTKRLEKMLITCSEQGAFLVTRKQVVHVPTKALKALDSTGAGDSFAAGYFAAMIQGKTEEEAINVGHKIAGQVIMHLGARTEVKLP